MKILYFYKKKISSLLLLLMLTLSASFVSAQTTITSTDAGGNWNLTTTWIGGVVPLITDNVIIATTGASKVTVSVSTSIVNVNINTGSTLDFGIRTLNVSGSFTNDGIIKGTSGRLNTTTGDSINNGSITLTSGRLTFTTGSLTNNGSIAMTTGSLIQSSGSITNTGTGTITFSGTGTITFATGNFINLNTTANSVHLGSSPITITGTATSQSIGAFTTTGIVSMTKASGIVTFTGNVNGSDLTINGEGGTLNFGTGNTHTFTGTWTRTNGTLNGGSSTLRIAGSVSGTGGTFTAASGTVEYNGAAAQTCAAVTYNNLRLLGTGVATKTFAATPTVNGVFSLEGTATVTGVLSYGGAATLQYNKSAAYTATLEEWPATFSGSGGVRIVNTGVISLGGNKNVTNVLSVATGSSIDLGMFSHTVGQLDLGETFQNAGTWGSTASSATFQDNTYFATSTGIISATNSACTLPVITTHPSPQTVCVNTGGSFSVVTSTSMATFQWQRSTDLLNWTNIDSSLAVNFSGFLTATLNILNAPIGWASTYSFRCIITSASGCSISSNIALLNVLSAPDVPLIGSVTSLTCAIPSGSVVLNSLPAGIWTITRNPGAITATGSGTTTTLTGIAPGNYTFTVSSGTCTSGSSASVLINPLETNTWNGSSWSLGAPTVNQNIVFAGDYSAAANVVGCSCTLTSGNITIPSGNSITVSNAIAGSATLTLENNATLVQTNGLAVNTASISAMRNTTPIINDDYTYWSSPTTGSQTLESFSPTTTNGNFYHYNNDWVLASPMATFNKGIGYAIRAEYGDTSAVVRPYQFTGVPNNGTIVIPFGVRTTAPDIGTGEILIGNPYPSTLDAEAFIDANLIGTGTINQTISGTLYFWTHNNSIEGTEYDGNDYATYTKLGGTAAGGGPNGSGNTTAPNRYIASGQGFFVDFEADGNITFTNAMRVGTNNTNFYKTANPKSAKKATLEAHRIWLNINNTTNSFSQALVGYVTNATNDYDPGFDGRSFGAKHDIYSVLDAETLTIQARALPFANSDIIPLGYSVNVAGSTIIKIDHVDGLFLGSQEIYLEDKLLNITHDLKANPYTFYSDIGTFDERFVLKYSNSSLGNDEYISGVNEVLVSTKNEQIKIHSIAETIDTVTIYDFLGRQIYQKEKVNSNELLIENIVSIQQTLIVKTVLQNGTTVTDKIMY